MNRRGVLTGLSGLAVSLAGCSALPIWDDDGSADPESPTDTSDDVPDADPDADEGDGPDVSYPDGYGPDGVEDAEAAISAHTGALSEADSYVFSYDSLVSDDDAETVYTYQAMVDNADETAYVVQDAGSGSHVAYYEDGVAYLRKESDDEVTYRSKDVEYSMTDFTGFQFVGPLLANVEYGGAEVFDGDEGRFYRYVSEEVFEPEGILRTEVDENRLDRFDVSVVVGEVGVVRQAAFAVEADRDVTANMGVGEIGTANVDRPEWYDEAADG